MNRTAMAVEAEALPDGFLGLDAADRVTVWNATLTEWSGLSCDEVVDRPIAELFPLDGRIPSLLARVRRTGQPRVLSQLLHGHLLRFPLPPGVAAPGVQCMLQECHVVPVREPAGHLAISIRDMTSVALERRRMRGLQYDLRAARDHAERVLADRERVYTAGVRREERFRSMVDSLQEIVFQTDLVGRWTFLNPVWAEVTGFPVEEALGREALEFMHPEDRAVARAALHRMDATGADHCRFEVRYRTARGSHRWIEELVQRASDQDGHPIGLSGTLNDITERKLTVERLRTSGRLLDAIRQAQSRFITAVDTRATFAALLSALIEITGSEYGYIAEAMAGADGAPYLRTHAISGRTSGRASGSWPGHLPAEKTGAETVEHEIEIRDPNSLFGAVLLERAPVLSNDAASDPRPSAPPSGLSPLRTFLGLPFFHDGEMLGAVGIANRAGGYGPEQVEFLQPFLSTCAQVTFAHRLECTRHRAEAALVEARDVAEAASRAKSDFLARMSHEIRTPLNGVLGFADLLLDSSLDERQRDAATIIRESGATLLAIINDILDFSKIEAGRLETERIPFEPAPILAGVLKLFETVAGKNGVQLHLECGSPAGLVLLGDPARFRQILTNLVSNAIKFTEQGAVTVRLESLDETRARVSVTDTGIGIPADKHALLFQEFSQVDGSATRRFGGTGLGLAICKRLVELMGGEIGCDSTPGRGSTFWLAMPVTAAAVSQRPRRAVAESSALSAAAAARQGRILVVEDNRTNQLLATHMISRLGFAVEIAVDGNEGVELASRTRYDLIFMDCHMPELDGYGATQAIRQLPGAAGKVPIVALTASVFIEDRQRCFDAGMNDFLTKPIDRDELRRTLDRWCSDPARKVATEETSA